jgi:hypothetical protein
MATGDLFDLGLPAIGHGCNCAGGPGAQPVRAADLRGGVVYRLAAAGVCG